MQASLIGGATSRVVRLSSWCVLLMAIGGLSRQAGAQVAAGANSIDYVIVVTGTELLAGAYADAHAPFLARTLHPRGLRCVLIMIVDDRQEEIEKAVRIGMEHAPLVITTGGLGPTEDDVTRQAISAATGVALAEHPALLAAMAKRFDTPEEQLRANLRRQAQVPVGGSYLENPSGTAAGLVFETRQGVVVALPGPPRELQPMVHEQLTPFLSKRFGIGAVGGLLRIRFVGIGESAISEVIERHVPVPGDVTIGALFEGMRVDYYFSLPGSAPEDITRLDVIKQQIMAQLGEFVYGTGATTLESAVLELLTARKETLALAEVGSGGSIAA
ncbi:MAG: molybdopterin-binding protein, partial [Patescibacteria group bacterium]|nr:molybdopterin-binding protein [Patescibacteria group bacterium]